MAGKSMYSSPFAIAGVPPPMKPVLALHSGVHVLTPAAVEQPRIPPASNATVLPVVFE